MRFEVGERSDEIEGRKELEEVGGKQLRLPVGVGAGVEALRIVRRPPAHERQSTPFVTRAICDAPNKFRVAKSGPFGGGPRQLFDLFFRKSKKHRH